MTVSPTRVAWGPVCLAALVGCASWAVPPAARAAPPLNDDFAAATVLSGDSPAVGGSTIEATSEPGEPDHAGDSAGRSVWYGWTPSRSGRIRLGCESDFDTVVAIYRGASVGALGEIGSRRLGVGCHSEVEFRAGAGVEYRIAVDAAGGTAGGAFTLKVANRSPVPPNDDFAAAQPFVDLGGNAIARGTTEGAGREAGEPAHGGSPTGSSVWFRWTAQRTGTTRIYPCEGSFHPVVAVYAGDSLGRLTPLGAPGDVGAGDPNCLLGGRGGVSFAAVAGRSYAVVVDGEGGAWGSFSLSLLEAPIADVFPPQTFIGWHKRLGSGRFRFRFSTAEPGAEFACKLDSSPFRPCASPVTYVGLAAGPHRFAVRATDAAGNVDPTPAVYRFRMGRQRGRRK